MMYVKPFIKEHKNTYECFVGFRWDVWTAACEREVSSLMVKQLR